MLGNAANGPFRASTTFASVGVPARIPEAQVAPIVQPMYPQPQYNHLATALPIPASTSISYPPPFRGGGMPGMVSVFHSHEGTMQSLDGREPGSQAQLTSSMRGMLPPSVVRASSLSGGRIVGADHGMGSSSGHPPSSGASIHPGDTISGMMDGQIMLGTATCGKRARFGNTAQASLALGSRIWGTSAEALGCEESPNDAYYGGNDLIDLDLNRANNDTSQPVLSSSSDGSLSDGLSTDLGISQAELKLRALIEACKKLEQVGLRCLALCHLGAPCVPRFSIA